MFSEEKKKNKFNKSIPLNIYLIYNIQCTHNSKIQNNLFLTYINHRLIDKSDVFYRKYLTELAISR